MSINKEKLVFELDKTCVKLLSKCRYLVVKPKDPPPLYKILLAFGLPLVALATSLITLSVTYYIVYVSLAAIFYKYFVVYHEYKAYQNEFSKSSSVASFLPETPLFAINILFLALFAMLAVMAFISIFHLYSDWAKFAGAVTILNVFVTWWLETVDALVALYDARIAVPQKEN